MPQIGVDIITSNCEYAGSQWEINFAPGRGMRGPDNAFTFKNGVKEIAKQDGYLATFMSKPFADSAGSGCHTHLSLLRTEDGDERARRRRRPGRALRRGPPLHRWAAALREGDRRADRADGELPPAPPPAHVQPDEHLLGARGPFGPDPGEGRLGAVRATSSTARRAALSNPYLVGAALLSAGLQGIEDTVDPGPSSRPGLPAEDDPDFEKLPTVAPRVLTRSRTTRRRRSSSVRSSSTAYTAMRRYELSRLSDWVTDWERAEYLELF